MIEQNIGGINLGHRHFGPILRNPGRPLRVKAAEMKKAAGTIVYAENILIENYIVLVKVPVGDVVPRMPYKIQILD